MKGLFADSTPLLLRDGPWDAVNGSRPSLHYWIRTRRYFSTKKGATQIMMQCETPQSRHTRCVMPVTGIHCDCPCHWECET